MTGSALLLSLSAGMACAQPVAATMLIKEGDALAGSTVSTLNTPFVDGNGKPGTVVALADSRRVILYNGAPIFTSDQALPDTLTGGEGTMGVGNNGEFIYSPSFNGEDAVWGQGGLIYASPQLFPNGFPSTFHSRPQMVDDGTSHWITGWNDAGGTSTNKRGLAQRAPNGTVSLLLQGGEATSSGFNVDASSAAVQFDFNFSGNGLHSIVEVELDTGDTNANNAYLIDLFTVVGKEGDPTGQGDDWDNMDAPSINNSGDYLFSGDTNGTTTSDEFLAYNSVIQVREGDAVAGVTLGGSCDGSSLNNLGEAVFVWTISGGGDGLFYASDASNISGTAVMLLRNGDSIDTTNDGVADWVVTDFNSSQVIGPGLDLGDDGVVWAEVDVDSADGLVTGLEAIIGIRFRTCPGDWDGSGGQPNSSDFLAYLNDWSAQDPAADLSPPGGDGVWDSSDFLVYLNLYSQGC
ncbi:MAG: GC-type dockerin domain-anchored protein [Phycisphaerales bacterium]|nr:GC-type dockerin domain-anchored protein [Phycisphaerales bacterium]